MLTKFRLISPFILCLATITRVCDAQSAVATPPPAPRCEDDVTGGKPSNRWKLALRPELNEILPCQQLYISVSLTNNTDKPLALRDAMGGAQLRIFAEHKGNAPKLLHVWGESAISRFALAIPDNDAPVEPGRSVFMDCLLVVPPRSIDWLREKRPERLFEIGGNHRIYAALVNYFSDGAREILVRSEPVSLIIRQPNELESDYAEFFSKGQQVPPAYGGFGRDIDRPRMIETLTDLLAKHPNPPIADDARDFLMHGLVNGAKLPNGSERRYDVKRLELAAEQYLNITPERKQLRRRSVKMWLNLSHDFRIDEAAPILKILASWKASSPYYKEETQSQTVMDKQIEEIYARFGDEARQKAAAPPPKPNPLPTD